MPRSFHVFNVREIHVNREGLVDLVDQMYM